MLSRVVPGMSYTTTRSSPNTVSECGLTYVRATDNRQLYRQALRVKIIFRRFFTILFHLELRPVFRVFIHLFLRRDIIHPRQKHMFQQAQYAATM